MDPISSLLLLGQHRSDSYWIATLGAAGTSEQANQISFDPSGNVYIVGSALTDIFLAKYDKNGALSWQRSLGLGDSDSGNAIAVDSGGDVYIGGSSSVPVVNLTTAFVLAKYNTNGVLQWQTVAGGTTDEFFPTASDPIRALALDSGGNIYVAIAHSGGQSYSTTNGTDATIRKFNSLGSTLWSKTVGRNVNDTSDLILGLVLDSGQNPIAVGYSGAGTISARNIFYYKLDSTGTTVTTDLYDGGANTQEDAGNDLAIDSQDNIYIVGTFDYVTSENNAFIVKIDSSRVVQWGRYLSAVSTQGFESVSISPTQYIYAAGSNGTNGLIAKYDLSGNLQWIRQLRLASAETTVINSIKVDSRDTMHVCGYITVPTAGPRECFIAKLPGDGSLLGTYGSFIYEEISLTSGTITFSSVAATFVSRTPSLSSKGNLTDAAGTLTSSTITI